ncbi:MAG: hypothetical protein ACLPR9_18215 [Acidimicrobiales bacterium]
MDPQEKKVALRSITYGLYVMTAAGAARSRNACRSCSRIPGARRTSARAGAFRPDACLGQVVEE